MDYLIDFNVWLQTHQGYVSRTATVYVSHVRRVLAEMSLQAVGTLTEWTSEQVEAVVNRGTPHQHANRRAAWNLFAGYMAAHKNLRIAMARAPSKKDPVVPPLPKSTLEAMVTLITRLRVAYATIERLSWRHINTQNTGGGYLVDPLGNRVWVSLPKEVIDGLRDWAQPDEGGNVPLIPESPGSLVPMSVKTMRAAFNKYVRTL